MYPRLEIDLSIISENITRIQKKCQQWNLQPVAVTKGFCADPPLVRLLLSSGITCFADSNILNLRRIQNLTSQPVELYLIRLPMVSECPVITDLHIIPFVSHLEILEILDREAGKRGVNCPVILAVENGDGREGFLPEELLAASETIRRFRHLTIRGLSTTLACLSGVLPNESKIREFIQWKRAFVEKTGLRDVILSVGGTTFFSLWEDGLILPEVNQIRCGEAFLFGSDISRKRDMAWLRQGAFYIETEIVEVREKKPEWNQDPGYDAFGRIPSHQLLLPYPHKRALLAMGLQDIDDSQLYLERGHVKIIGATSNYLVIDIEDDETDYHVGEVIRFRAG
ncbi:MAG: alanine racemase, partial [Candidatus Atribacteria bacterium]|nr:alanine racemase [Candidatus Atribacteria bacterium]